MLKRRSLCCKRGEVYVEEEKFMLKKRRSLC